MGDAVNRYGCRGEGTPTGVSGEKAGLMGQDTEGGGYRQPTQYHQYHPQTLPRRHPGKSRGKDLYRAGVLGGEGGVGEVGVNNGN